MGRWKAWALAWLLAATLSALLLQAPAARGDELLVNGGFDDGIAPWTAKGGTLEAVQGLGRDSSVGGVFTTDGSSYHYVRQCIPASEGNGYRFQGYAAAASETPVVSAYLLVSWYADADCQGQELGTSGDTSEAVILEPPGLWHSLALEVSAAPAGSRSARVGIAIEQSSATVYLDDFSFTGPPAPSPSPSPTQTPPPTATPSPSPGPTASPKPSPTVVPTATQAPTPTPSTPSPSPTATSRAATPLPAAELVNGGFEEADGEGKPIGWRKWGGVLSRSSAARRDGQYAGAFTSRTASTKWAFQTVAVEGDEAYVLSGYARKNDANVQAAYLRLSWYASPDGSGSLIDSVDSTMRLTDDSPDFRFLSTGPVVAPAEAASAKVRLMLDPLSEAEGTVYFDDISFDGTTMPPQPEGTPQPSTPIASSERPKASPIVPTAAVEELEPSSSPGALPARLSPTVPGATPSAWDATVFSRDGSSQSGTSPKGSSTRTPVVLYRERRTGQSSQGGEGVAVGGDEGDGPSPIALALVTAAAAGGAAATAFLIWRRWKKRARPP